MGEVGNIEVTYSDYFRTTPALPAFKCRNSPVATITKDSTDAEIEKINNSRVRINHDDTCDGLPG